ncbi:S8 family serine peptidase [Youngiibacter fragilis]|uniref:Peptidase S8 n=1 Tax=Youngiibacter fragilis 232.1 TaxID=994573 RepID=V7I641_9CLOT|nr:S8 family serine peptidase [Youngiibacter fragilis]ETA80766.1 peptidase S8 [Youngiibacter fragilis 232.1]
MRRYTKSVALMLIAAFLFTATGFSLKADAGPRNFKALESSRTAVEKVIGKNVSLKDAADVYKDSDNVRLIVELKGKPVISYATEKGVKVTDLDKNQVQSIRKTLLAEQKALKAELRAKGIGYKDLKNFVNVVNGVSIETTFGNAKKISKLAGVLSVSIAHEYERPEPTMTSSKDIVNAIETWEYTGYDGSGMVIAIIDTGIDPSHRDFIITDPSSVKIMDTGFGELPGSYRTVKVPYGYNYMDENQEILDLGPDASEHGMHVAGIAAANGDEENGGIKGVAPEAQLLAMKVFGNNPEMPSTFGDVIIKAIDDSIALGADVINMSLGSTAAFVQEDDLEQVAVRRAVENGVVCAISAGNAGQFSEGFDLPYSSNPDIGVIGAPGLATESIQVASIENTYISAKALTYIYGGVEVFAPYISAGPVDPIAAFEGPVTYLAAGLGYPTDFTGKDFTGKIALIQRGELAFVDKIMNAQNAGAAGVIIYNHEAGGEELINMMYPESGSIPAVFIGHSDGVRLMEKILEGTNTVEFNGDLAKATNPEAGNISGFSSWGTTPSLDFKPEVTAPGGNIWSTAQGDDYQSMSGTSMAAPHVAGGSALVLQRVEDLADLEGDDKAILAKNLILSTASAHHDTGLYNDYYGLTAYNFTSPRRQGAGVMDLYAATTTPAVAYEKTSGESKAALGQIGNKKSFVVKIDNFSDKPVTYSVKGTVQTDLVIGGYNYLESQGVYIASTIKQNGPNGYWSGKFPISFSKTRVTVPAKGSVEVTVSIDLSKAVDWAYNAPLSAIFPNGTYIEGFVVLEDPKDINPELSIPYVGFYGDWDEAPVVDKSIYEDGSYYGITSMTWYHAPTDNLYFQGMDADGNVSMDNIAFSPDGNGIADNTVPLLSFLRNARDFEVNILDSDRTRIRSLHMDEFIRKNFFDSGYNPMYTVSLDWLWDGTANNTLVPEGQYYYEIRSVVDFEGADWQTVVFPVKVDITRPVISGIQYDKGTKVLTITASDSFSGISGYQIYEDGKVPMMNTTGVFDLSAASFTSKAYALVTDFAENTVYYPLSDILKSGGKPERPVKPEEPAVPTPIKEPKNILAGDTTAPVARVLYPEFFGIYNTGTIVVQGTVSDESPLDYLKIDGVMAELVWNNKTGLWDFAVLKTFADGYHSMNIEAADMAGNYLAYAHKIFVDTTSPEIMIGAELPLETAESSITLKALVTDNLPSMKVRLNQNILTNIAPDWSYFDDLPSATYELDEVIELQMGENLIVIEAEDGAGNAIRYEMRVTRTE